MWNPFSFEKKKWILPTEIQIKNAVQDIKKKLGMKQSFTFADVVELKKNMEFEDEKVGVVEFKHDDKDFAIIISSKQLIQDQSQSSQMQCDATFKLNKEDYPVVIVGYSDQDLHLHRTVCVIISSMT